MNATRNDLPKKVRFKIVALLNQSLSDAIDLMLQAKQAHWNIKGPQFIALHELFDKVSDTVEEAVDLVAERAVQLGGTALGTVAIVAKQSALKDYPTGITTGPGHVEALSEALAAFGKSVRARIDECTALGDADTADLFTGISRDADKLLWLVETHNLK